MPDLRTPIPRVDSPNLRDDPDAWKDDAACVRIPLAVADEVFFPLSLHTRTAYERGRKICAACPVRELCKAEVMANEAGLGQHSRHGMVAGLTPMERYELDENRPPPKRKFE